MEDTDTASEAKTLQIKIARGQNGSESSGGADVVSLFPAEMHTLAHSGGSALSQRGPALCRPLAIFNTCILSAVLFRRADIGHAPPPPIIGCPVVGEKSLFIAEPQSVWLWRHF